MIQTRAGESRFDVMTRQLQAQHPLNAQPTPTPPQAAEPSSLALLRPPVSTPSPVSVSAPPILPQSSSPEALEQSRRRVSNTLQQLVQQRPQPTSPPGQTTPSQPQAVPGQSLPAQTAYAPHLHQTPPTVEPQTVSAPRGQTRNLNGVATVYYQGDHDGSGGQTSVGLPMREIEGSSRFKQGLPVVAALSTARRHGINAGDVLLVEVNGTMQGVYVGDIGSGGPSIRGKQRMLDFTPTVFRNTGISSIYANPDVKILEEFSGQRAYVGTDASPRNAPRRERLMQALNQLAQANATRDETQIREAAARVAQVQQEIS